MFDNWLVRTTILLQLATTIQAAEQVGISHEPCKTSRLTRYDIARRHEPVFFSTDPMDDFELPKVMPPNSTTGEQWGFDGISESGREAFMIGFYRDPSFAVFGTGNLRFYLEFAFANGSRHAAVEYAEESIVESCPGKGTRGTWRGDGWAYGFDVSADMKRAEVFMDSPYEKGRIVMNSIARPRYADNAAWPSKDASSEPIPFWHWVEPIPVAEVDFDIAVLGEKVSWTGMGGHERLWNAFNWLTSVASLTAVRLRAGPFALSLVQWGSHIREGLVVPSVLLAKDGETVFSTRRTTSSETEDHLQMRKIYDQDGFTTKALDDKATGFELVLNSPRRESSWAFNVTHRNIGFEYPFGGGLGSTGYSGVVKGGQVGGEAWEGPAFSEIMNFPKNSILFSNNYFE
ncbi:hypothetical protein GGS21DRAFT_74375 [Xylaria nigripes]|nr:hypothetical protein GGS21DRAFT_74375 [Xylaria nigripes]